MGCGLGRNQRSIPEESIVVDTGQVSGYYESITVAYAEWRQKYIRTCSNTDADGLTMLYVYHNGEELFKPKEAVTVSEAIGYGMLISVMMHNQTDFDGLLHFYNHFHVKRTGLMEWQQVKAADGTIVTNPNSNFNGGSHSATDGDMDAAYALFLAAGIFKEPAYHHRALAACNALHEWCINPDTHIPYLGDWVTGPHAPRSNNEGVLFKDIARPSDWSIAHFVLFQKEDKLHADSWTQVGEACIGEMQHHLESYPTGLFSDFVLFDPASKHYLPAEGRVLERPEDSCCSYNSCRVPWRLAVYFWETGDQRVASVMHAQLAFFEKEEVIAAGYTLEGKKLVEYSNICFLAPVSVLFQVLGHPDMALIHAQMKDNLGGGNGQYFGETILMAAELQLSQKWLGSLHVA